ncbi:thioredoxin domain-containing protein [Nocardioides pakistanensis]
MDVTLLYFNGCPNWQEMDEALVALAAEHPDLHLTRRRVETPQEAEEVGFHGSPTVMVDGRDAFDEPDLEVGLTCRRYATPDGYRGAPTLDQLRRALGLG